MKLRAANYINRKISRRFSFAVVMTILLVMSLFMLLDLQTSIRNERKLLDEKMATLTEITKNALTQALWNFDEKGEKTIADSLMKDAEIAKILVFNENNQPLYAHEKEGTAYTEANLIRIRTAIVYEGAVIGYAELHFTRFFVSGNIQALIMRRLLLTGVLMLAMVLTVLLISKRITKPIEDLSRETTLIASGDLSRRIHLNNQDEIGNLADKLNMMVSALAQARAEIAQDAIALEALVEARTGDYNRANSELKLKNEELERTLTIFHETQDELIETKKMAALGTLVAGVAHEINTPLGNGITMASFLQKIQTDIRLKIDDNALTRQDLINHLADLSEATAVLSTNLERSASLVQHFKQLAVDLSTDEKTTFDLHENIETVLISLRHEYAGTKHQLENLCAKGFVLTSYPGEYSQIFTHLIKNSLEHGFNGLSQGIIQISARLVDAHQLCIDYRDNGTGISEEDRSRVFDPFYTTSRYHGNVGLGLNIVHNIVTHKLQGTIRCNSTPGKGVHFVILLPLHLPT